MDGGDFVARWSLSQDVLGKTKNGGRWSTDGEPPILEACSPLTRRPIWSARIDTADLRARDAQLANVSFDDFVFRIDASTIAVFEQKELVIDPAIGSGEIRFTIVDGAGTALPDVEIVADRPAGSPLGAVTLLDPAGLTYRLRVLPGGLDPGVGAADVILKWRVGAELEQEFRYPVRVRGS